MQQALAKANEIYVNGIHFDEESLKAFSPSKESHSGIVLDFAHNLEEELMRIDLGMTLDGNVISEVIFHYKIEKLERFYEISEGKMVNFDNAFISQLCGISYATLRGLVLALTRNASNVLLPIVDPQLIVETFHNKRVDESE
ncbi:hypothetical protein [Leeuwenhoekiella aequorea]|uniref:Preprotein translocase subunit SecB n=1 Tax=Leeuwenhoekiella aequorea TaxID=283736 RepID=A0A4Q0P3G0_9FLAO|nr:hypothetical protein [Leeuwenhoekiella aequorea]RXG21110.1 hypothetical protein DSM00_2627 [Leeuwenhoekiella aequorea]